MNYSPELCKLVIQNLNVLEVAPKIVDEIEDKIFEEIKKRCEDSFKKEKGWKVNFDFSEGIMEFYPGSWIQEQNEIPIAKIKLTNIEKDDDDSFWLSLFLGLRPGGEVAFSFSIDYNVLRVDKRGFKRLLVECFDNNSELQKLGFRLNDDTLALTVVLNEKILVEEYPDDLDKSFVPIDKALKVFHETLPVLTEMTHSIRDKAELKNSH